MDKYKLTNNPSRRKRAYVSLTGVTIIHLRNPFIIACWSAAFPGLGHLLLSKYTRGFLLFLWEVFINYQSHINLAILYSLTGKFDMVKGIIDINWSLLYIPTYIFAIFDSYKSTVDLNNVFILAAREDSAVVPFRIGALEISFIDKKTPWVAAIWSLLSPGTGQLYIHRVIVAFFIFVWWIMVVYSSKLLPAIHYTLLGQFNTVKHVINWQWLLNIPSLYMYSMYDAYVNCVEENNLFDWEQCKFLKRNYQNRNFRIPCQERGTKGDTMYIISTFDYSIYLELAITSIELNGIKKENIFAIPVEKANNELNLLDTIHHSDSVSLMDLAAILGAICMLFGSIYGFILEWGPIWWGVIGLFVGFSSGIIIKLVFLNKFSSRNKSSKEPEVVLIIECSASLVDSTITSLWANHALGVSKLDHGK